LTAFAGTLQNVPVIPGQVLFDSISVTNTGLSLYDANGDGLLTGNGDGTINYITGAFNLLFFNAPGSGQAINSQTIPYQPARPTSVLYFDNQFVFRPIPDQPYAVNIEVNALPSQLINAGDVPNINQWWQYIAYGTAKKILEFRSNWEAVAQIQPKFEEHERLVLRTTIMQQSTQRAATIYKTQFQENNGPGNGWFNGN